MSAMGLVFLERVVPEYFGLEGEIDIIYSTLSKALGGGTGGYTSAIQEVIDVLRQKIDHIFSRTLFPLQMFEPQSRF